MFVMQNVLLLACMHYRLDEYYVYGMDSLTQHSIADHGLCVLCTIPLRSPLGV